MLGAGDGFCGRRFLAIGRQARKTLSSKGRGWSTPPATAMHDCPLLGGSALAWSASVDDS